MFDPEKFGAEVGRTMKALVEPLQQRIAYLESGNEVSQDDILAALKSDPEFMQEIVADYIKHNPVGAGVAGALIDQKGHLVLTLSNGEARDVGPVVGRDGYSLEDFSVEYDGERGLTLMFCDAVVDKSFTVNLPCTIHRGYWRQGHEAKAGDAWTSDGSLWIAKADTDTKPSWENKEFWTMAAQKGRDGADGKMIIKEPEKPVDLKKKDD